MQGMYLVVPVHLHGTLAANAQGAFDLPFNATLESVMALAANDSDATLRVGLSTDTDSAFAAGTIGDSSTPKWMTLNGASCVDSRHRLIKGEILTWLLDFDGAGGTAAQNVEILFFFTQG